MNLYSTNNTQLNVSFKEAVFNSLPPDGGLYMPRTIPQMGPEFFAALPELSLTEIAFQVSAALLDGAILEEELKRIVTEAINFDAPLRPLKDGTRVLELFHGPSLAFKDFGARFMSRIMGYLSAKEQKELHILVATSGDTGGAVALGFLGVPGTKVTILYPKGKVSDIQELQLCSNGQNIHALEVEGTFDDCQALVKKAFNDASLNQSLRLTSANSINIARLIPQSFYYFYAYGQAVAQGFKEVVFSVPSGNFGNIAAGLLAREMGLPVKRFLAATNSNDVVPRFLDGGVYEPRPAIATLSNAMDVGDPSNWVRILELFKQDLGSLSAVFSSTSRSDDQTQQAISELFADIGYLACPHTAIAWDALKEVKDEPGLARVFLSTAHPCKFPSVYPAAIRDAIQVPESVNTLKSRELSRIPMGREYRQFHQYLMKYV